MIAEEILNLSMLGMGPNASQEGSRPIDLKELGLDRSGGVPVDGGTARKERRF